MQRNFVSITKTQPVFKVKIAAAKLDLVKYRNGKDVPGGRLDLGAMYRDIASGNASPAMMAAFKAFQANRGMLEEVARPTTALKGVELSAAGRPMRKDNPCVDSISKIPSNSVVVSRDVFQQLEQSQADELAKHVGIHEYCKVQTGKVSFKNPTGEWPEVEKQMGNNVYIDEGKIVDKAYTFRVHLVADLKRLSPSPLEFSSPAAFEAMGIATGTKIKVDEHGVHEGRPGASTMNAKVAKRELAKFRFADPVGRHLDDIEVVGEVRRKYDGIFHYAEVKCGFIIIKTRNGVQFHGKVDCCDMTFAFELDGEHAHVIYVRTLGLNPMPLYGAVQDFLCGNLTFEFGGVGHTGEHDWQFDGYVIRNNTGHYFLKDKKTVDITWHQAAMLRDEGHNVADFGSPEHPGVIYELDVAAGSLINPRLRLRNGKCDKVFPNHIKRVEYAMVAPTWSEYRRKHGITI